MAWMPCYSSHNVPGTEAVSPTTVARIDWDDCSVQCNDYLWGAGQGRHRSRPRWGGLGAEQPPENNHRKWASQKAFKTWDFTASVRSSLPLGPSSSSVQVPRSQPWEMSRKAESLKKPEPWSPGLPEVLKHLHYNGFQSAFRRGTELWTITWPWIEDCLTI